MANPRFFTVTLERQSLIVTPLQSIGNLADEEVQVEWDEILARLENSEAKHVVFDFEKLSYFGSSMLEAMLVLWKRVHPNEGKMAICNTTEATSKIFQLSKLDTIWPICDSRQAALDTVHA